ncbi:MAG: hypothetical protein HY843_01715 [Bdellovibrio sp.]|nr:hypothetical protein [Bdellovibrio sp.]
MMACKQKIGFYKPNKWIFFYLLCFFISSCNDITTPDAVFKKSYNALIDDDLKLWNTYLRDEASIQYGHDKGLCCLQKRLFGMEVKLDDEPVLFKTELDSCKRETKKYYKANAMGQKELVHNSGFQVLIAMVILCEYSNPASCQEPKTKTPVCLIKEIY